jgi:hypothetical protein
VEKLDVFGNVSITGTARSRSTLGGDSGTTLVTKDYVIARKPGASTIIKGFPCLGGGIAGDTANNVIDCSAPPPNASTLLLKRVVSATINYPAGSSDDRMLEWNQWIERVRISTDPIAFAAKVSLNANPGICSLVVPRSNPADLAYYFAIPTSGSLEFTSRVMECGGFIGMLEAIEYYQANPPRPPGFLAGFLTNVNFCQNSNMCDGITAPGAGGGWGITTMW